MSPSLRQYRRCRIRDNDSNFKLDKLNRNLGVAVAAVLRPAILNRDRATLDPTEFAQSMRKSGGPQSVGRSRGRAQEPNGRQLRRLLRARRERPRGGRAAEQRDEFASSQGWHGLSPPRAAGFPHSQPSTEGWAGPWANPESF